VLFTMARHQAMNALINARNTTRLARKVHRKQYQDSFQQKSRFVVRLEACQIAEVYIWLPSASAANKSTRESGNLLAICPLELEILRSFGIRISIENQK
jgi:hypothetical protein